jgi:VanZ family protein
MLPLHHTRRWRLASVALLVTVTVAAMMPAIWIWRDLARMNLSPLDKWLHFFTFLFLAIWFAGQYHKRSYWRIALGLFAFGILIEVCQRMVSYRTSDLMDLAADTIGIVAGLGIAVIGVGGWSLRFEQWLRDRAEST